MLADQTLPKPKTERMAIVMYTCRNRRCTAELAAKFSQVGESLKCPYCHSKTKIPNGTPVDVDVEIKQKP